MTKTNKGSGTALTSAESGEDGDEKKKKKGSSLLSPLSPWPWGILSAGFCFSRFIQL